ncbi:hypothetical protein JCM11251_004453 [Rhodosporidiobolus azoricus]
METDDVSLEALRAEVAELKQKLATSYRQPFASTSALPPFQPVAGQSRSLNASNTSFDPTDSSTSAHDDTQELARKYRLTGRSCFPVELARGARAKEEIKAVERERKKRRKGKERAIEDDEADRVEDDMVRKGVAVRLETFYAGRYYEPYYIVFSHHLPDLDGPTSPNPQLYIPHHTIPHWVPLAQLTWRYLGVRLQSEDTHPADLAGDEKGGEADLELFLSHLQVYLTAFVSRREQLVALRSAFSPKPPSASPVFDFRLFASEPCDRFFLEWNIASAREQAKRDDDDDDDDDEEDGEEVQEKVLKSVVVQVAFHDLRIERFEEIDGEKGASLLVRYSEKHPGDNTADEIILTSLAEEAVRSREEGRTLEEVVKSLVAETTRDGWAPAE